MTAQAFHVGEYLQDELDARSWTTRDCAERMGGATAEEVAIDELTLNLTLASASAPHYHAANDAYICEETARKLALAFGTSAELWINLQKSFFENRSRVN